MSKYADMSLWISGAIFAFSSLCTFRLARSYSKILADLNTEIRHLLKSDEEIHVKGVVSDYNATPVR